MNNQNQTPHEPRRLMKSSTNKKLAGVCGGLAEYFGLDATLIRVIFALFGVFGAGILAYIVLLIVMPKPE
ncbi:MAG: PspC domain-containing protein [Clostridiales bacterium]|nr:PspC domain-containing protein [Clostridiales bacterium]